MAENEEIVVADAPVVDAPAVEITLVDAPAGDEGPKSVAEAVDAAIESAPKVGPKPPGEAADKVEGEEAAGADKADKKDDGKDPAKKGDEKTDDGKTKVAEPDHVNDPIPKELNARTQERIRSLVGSVKERDSALEVQGNLIKAIQDTGVSGNDFAETIGFLRLVNSQKPEDIKAALTIVQQQAKALALRLGEEIPGVDLLEGHPELQDAVKYGQITRAHALQVAQLENQKRAAKEAEARTRTESQDKAGLEAARTQAITVLNDIGVQLQKTDPDYQRKYDALVEPMKAAFPHIHPSKWPEAFQNAWKALKLPPAVAAPAEPPAGMIRDASGKFVKAAPKSTPIRPANPAGSGGGAKAPGSVREAIDSALAGLSN